MMNSIKIILRYLFLIFTLLLIWLYSMGLKDKIDYIFVNEGFKVQKFAVLSDSKDKRYYSDHLPVFVKLFFLE